jgi:O-antigen ligase
MGNDRLIRGVLFLAAFMQVALTANPFPDLSSQQPLTAAEDGHLLGQLLELAITAILGVYVYVNRLDVVLKALTPILVATFIWFFVSALLSLHPGLAARRLVLAALTIFKAAVLLLLPQDRKHFGNLVALAALMVLVLCYLGVIFMPEFSIHHANDVAEPELQGNWRGFFTHKNGAGAAMVLLVFFGIYVARSGALIAGIVISTLAGIFLIFTESKSPMMLLPLVLAVSGVLNRVHYPAVRALVIASVPLTICVMTIGSVEFDSIHAAVASVLADPTFTGRNVIWRFALDHIGQRPIVGFGYQAFWQTSELLNAWTYLESWGYRASDAHNGYLNVALTTGIVGLVLSLLWIFGQPLLDQIRTPECKRDVALNTMFLQIWLFALYLSGFESDIFSGGSIVWFMTVFAVLGFRFQSNAEYVVEKTR